MKKLKVLSLLIAITVVLGMIPVQKIFAADDTREVQFIFKWKYGVHGFWDEGLKNQKYTHHFYIIYVFGDGTYYKPNEVYPINMSIGTHNWERLKLNLPKEINGKKVIAYQGRSYFNGRDQVMSSTSIRAQSSNGWKGAGPICQNANFNVDVTLENPENLPLPEAANYYKIKYTADTYSGHDTYHDYVVAKELSQGVQGSVYKTSLADSTREEAETKHGINWGIDANKFKTHGITGRKAWTITLKEAGLVDKNSPFEIKSHTGDDVKGWKTVLGIKADSIFTVNFDLDGGQGNIENQKVVKGAKVKAPAEPSKAGSVFKGWIKEDGTAFDFSTPIMGNTNLKAKWELVDSEKYTPQVTPVEKQKGDTITEEDITGAVNIPEYPVNATQPEIKIKDGETVPDGTAPGEYFVKVVVTYPDGTSEEVTVKVIVKDSSNNNLVDTDGDGIPNITDIDDDNDGFTDKDENAAGTDPLDPNSKPTKNTAGVVKYSRSEAPKTGDGNSLILWFGGILASFGTILFTRKKVLDK